MLAFISEELVWAIRREREEEARKVRPHTARRQPTQDAEPPPPGGAGSHWFDLQPQANAR
jgi:hypothetical protein